ncbi:MAG: hypothetical protein EU549_02760 [Promethearchaeota archaeon]|nr:MAG: hypothetical protein EU549_02760 [Candidatus Lokiarchaeota archaeon]
MDNGIWNATPTQDSIIFALKKNKGVIVDQDLLKILKNEYDYINKKELQEILLKMEVLGIIHVSRIVKNKNRIELTEKYKKELIK